MCATPTQNPIREDDGTKRTALVSPYVGLVINGKTSLELGLNSYIRGAKIDHEIGKLSCAEVRFANLNPQLADDIRWSESQEMRIFVGYGSHPERVNYQGIYRMSNPMFGHARGSRKIVISGLGDGVPMINTARRRVFESMTYSQIVSDVIGPYGYTLQSNINFKEIIPTMVQDGISDYAFLRNLATIAGVDFFVWASNVFFMAPAIKSGTDPFIIRGTASIVRQLDFSVVGEGQAAVVGSSPVDPLTGKSFLVTTEYTADGILDLEGTSGVRFTRLARPTVIYKDATGSLLSQAALQATVDSEGADRKQIVKVNATIDGTEQIMPRKLVAFTQCGARFVGPFYITKVVHEIVMQGTTFTTRFEGVRATTGDYRQAFGGDQNSESVGGTPEPMVNASRLSRAAS